MFSRPRHHGKTEETVRWALAQKAGGHDLVIYCHPDHAQKWRDLGFKVWCDQRKDRGTPAGPKDTEVGQE
jgi:hypothetical protein